MDDPQSPLRESCHSLSALEGSGPLPVTTWQMLVVANEETESLPGFKSPNHSWDHVHEPIRLVLKYTGP